MTRNKTLKRFVRAVQRHIDHRDYPFFLALAAFLDTFLIVIPTDGIVISSVMARPKRWFAIFLGISIGSVLGIALLGAILHYDTGFIKGLAPWIFQSKGWAQTQELVRHYGAWAVFVGGLGLVPPTQPFIIIPILAGMNFTHWLLAFSLARFIKFAAISWLGSHSPRLFSKSKFLRRHLENIHLLEKDD